MTGIMMAVLGGAGGPSIPENTVAPVVTGTAQVGQTLSCTTGTWTGAAPITYTYQWQYGAGNTDISGATSSTYVIQSAYVGQTIRCLVTATNSIGAVSAPSNSTSAVSATVPTAPTVGTVDYNTTTSLRVNYTASSSDGGSTITSYTAVSSPGNITGSISTSGSGTITVSGLTKGQAYTFVVYATNAIGNSPNSASSASKIASYVPGPPTSVTATATSTTTASVSFVPPVDNGGQPVTEYMLTTSPSGPTLYTASSPFTVTGLTSGNTYTFNVRAMNAVGYSTTATSNSLRIPVGGYIVVSNNQWPVASYSGNEFYALTVDSSGNLFVGGYFNRGNGLENATLKVSSAGSLTYAKSVYGFGTGTPSYTSIASDGRQFHCNYNGDTNVSFTSDGTTGVYGNSLAYFSANKAIGMIDGGGSVYFAIRTVNANPSTLRLVKQNLSGAVTWGKTYTGNYYLDYASINSAGTTIMCFNAMATGIRLAMVVNSSGTTLYTLASSTNLGNALFASVDSSNNAYVCFASSNVIAKYDSTGTVVWARAAGGGFNLYYNTPPRIDSSGNIYLFGSVSNGFAVMKIGSAGNLIWQRKVTLSAGTPGVTMFASWADNSNAYVAGRIEESGQFAIQMPGSGAGTGTLTAGIYSFSYAASSYTFTSSSLDLAVTTNPSTSTYSQGAAIITGNNPTSTSFTPTIASF